MKASFIVLSLILCVHGQGQVFRLANVYSNEMVLQMEPKSAHIWGWGEPEAQLKLSLDNLSVYTAVNVGGRWSVKLPPQPAGGPKNIVIDHTPANGTTEQITLVVHFGDVWICSGQSNMDMKMREIFNATEEIALAASYANIRIMQVSETTSDVELEELGGTTIPWSTTDFENVTEFSAACLLFGERMADQFAGQRPIGLVDVSWPGTRIEAWSSARVTLYCNTPPSEATNQNADNVLWNGMIYPLTLQAVRGAVWYQGENNVNYNRDYYACHIQRLIFDWKSVFIDGTVPAENGVAFPFGIFQLGPVNTAVDDYWGTIRWSQSVGEGTVPNAFIPEAFMAASYDLTDRTSPTSSIHPRDKQTVCTRLANAAKTLLYNGGYHMNGPVATDAAITAAGQITLTYDRDIRVQASDGFVSRNVSGNNWIPASISSVSGREVTVTYDPAAIHLAYAWEVTICEYKQCAIYSADPEDLPAQVWFWDLQNIAVH